MTRKAKLFWALFVSFLVLDQLTKWWVYTNLAEGPGGDAIAVIPGVFDIVHAQNPGAAFSLFRDMPYNHLFFLGFTAVATWIVWDQYKRLKPEAIWVPAALGLILSGAVGNAIDRVHKRTVTDFLRVYVSDPEWAAWLRQTVGMSEWPSFNVADSALLVGVVIFFIATWREDEETASAAQASGEHADAAATGTG
ncbi:MAG: signal peptidase II [Alphaproteobacteria bacterium]|nr:signal peptidase II [Alphaproteobacteria bacterium]